MLEHRDGVRRAISAAPERHARFSPSGGASAQATSRLKIAHLALLGQGLALGILGGFALAWSMANLRFGPEGMPILGLAVTPLHGGLLMGCGSLAVLACLGRWTTLAFSAIAAGGWLALTIVCAVEAAHHVPGVLGFDPRDTVLYAGLGAYNLVVFAWLLSARSALRP